MGERIVRNDEVVGSIPTSSTKNRLCVLFASGDPHLASQFLSQGSTGDHQSPPRLIALQLIKCQSVTRRS